MWLEAEGEKYTLLFLFLVGTHYLKHATFQPQVVCSDGDTSLYVEWRKATQRRASSLASPPFPFFLINFLNSTLYFVSNFQAFWKALNSQALGHCGCLIYMRGLALVWE